MNLLDIHIFSDVLGMQTRVKVALPVRTKGEWGKGLSLSTDGDFGAMYLLHGMGNGYTAWEQWTTIERVGDGRNLAYIMPEAYIGWYTDCKYGMKWYTYLTEELPRKMHEIFPHISDKREETFIAGMSMGGYGALKCALKESDRFAAAGIFAAGIDMGYIINDETNDIAERKFMEDIFGSPEEFYASDNNLFNLAEMHKNDSDKTRLFFGCGRQDRFYNDNVQMRDNLKEKGWELVWNEADYGHDFTYWDILLPAFLNWIDEGRKK